MTELIKNAVLTFDINGASSFTREIYVDFIPELMKVKYIAYNNAGGAEDILATIYTDIVNDNIGVVLDPHIYHLDTKWMINKPIRGLYRFEIKDETGALQDVDGNVVIHLEFSAKK